MKLEIYKFTWNDVISRNVIYKYFLISDNRSISQITIANQNSCDSIAVQELMNFFEDHINEMFDLSNRPIIHISTMSWMNPLEKLCEFTYTECELKKLRLKKKIEEINKDFN